MAIDYQDSVAQFEAERRKERERSTQPPFFFALKDGQKANVRFLLDYSDAPACKFGYHEMYDSSKKEYTVNAVCAQAFGKECVHCAQAKETGVWKLKAQQHVYLPIYVHGIKELRGGLWVVVTYQEDGVEKPVQGLRVLDMKFTSSTILDALALAYAESSDDLKERTITDHDFVISRNGAGLDTKYTVSQNPRAPLALPADQRTNYTADWVKSSVTVQRPYAAVGEEEGAELGTPEREPFAPDDDF